MSETSFHTPEPWTVEPYVDCEGCYRLREAVTEQRDWVAEGYGEMLTDAEEAEGTRRNEIAMLHDAGNAWLMQRSPAMFRLLTFVANRLNLEERENPGGKYILAAYREEINQLLAEPPQNRKELAMDYTQKAGEVWQGMNKDEKAGVRFGLFPADKMRQVEAEGYDSHQFVLALMDQAKADGGMRA